jgi:hypothetical protein
VTGSINDRLHVVKMTVTLVVIVVVKIWSTLIFQGDGTRQGKGVVASFWLVPENSGSWCFLWVGA